MTRHIPGAMGDWLQCPGYRKKILLNETDLNSKGGLIQLVEIAPNTSVAKHYHKHCTEVFHVISGRGTFEIDGNIINLEPGDTLTCEPNEIHSTHNMDDVAFLYVVVKTKAEPNDLYWVE